MKIDSAAKTLIRLAVAEDLGSGDVTSELVIGKGETAKAQLVSRQNIIVCGMDIAKAVLSCYHKKLILRVLVKDGQCAARGQVIGTIEGPLRAMLSAERVVLNFLQRLCGIATLTAQYVAAVKGTRAGIYDTRKTTPGWRTLEKYAVTCGGGFNHRVGLYDAVLIKDNHIAQFGDNIAGALKTLVAESRKYKNLKFFQVEVDSLSQLKEVLKVRGIDMVLLDNFSTGDMKKAVLMRNRLCGPLPLLEASGGVNLKTVRAIAKTGVDRISVGAITHSAPAVDIGLDRE